MARTAHHADSEERASPTRVPELKFNPTGQAIPCAREIAVSTSTLVWWRPKDIFVETPVWRAVKWRSAACKAEANARAGRTEILQKQSEDEEMEGEVVQDLNGDVHMKLSVPLVSRENRGPARVCNCTVF